MLNDWLTFKFNQFKDWLFITEDSVTKEMKELIEKHEKKTKSKLNKP